MGRQSSKRKTIRIDAIWDDGAGVWSATSSDVRGLAIEAKTQEKLVARLRVVIPELLELNHPEFFQAEPKKSPPPFQANLSYQGEQMLGFA